MECGSVGTTSGAKLESSSEPIAWASPAMRQLERDLTWACKCEVNVLISGEQGAGKKAFACRIHRGACRNSRSLILAGGSNGSDTVVTLAAQLAQATSDGTILLDHPERMAPPLQLQLLEFVERRKNRDEDAVRFLTVTRDDVFERVANRQFSDALFYRLNTIHLVIPPLRERPEDVPVLFEHFFSRYSPEGRPRISVDAWQQLVTHSWPGNIGELHDAANILASLHLQRPLRPSDLPAYTVHR